MNGFRKSLTFALTLGLTSGCAAPSQLYQREDIVSARTYEGQIVDRRIEPDSVWIDRRPMEGKPAEYREKVLCHGKKSYVLDIQVPDSPFLLPLYVDEKRWQEHPPGSFYRGSGELNRELDEKSLGLIKVIKKQKVKSPI